MLNFGKTNILNLYQNKSKIKWVVLVVSALISVASIVYTNYLVNQLKEQEKWIMQLYAKSLEYTANASPQDEIHFITHEILIINNEIPFILTVGDSIIDSRNIIFDEDIAPAKRRDIERKELSKMKKGYEPILLTLKGENGEVFGVQQVYYRNSFLLTQLTYYPYVQLSVISIFAFVAYLAFNYSRTAEQNRVWVGLAKETAHQLGTPISSLMAWVEYFKIDDYIKSKGIVEELDKDIKKLQLITERFSNIGSAPVLRDENMYDLVSGTVNYLRPRISTKVVINISTTSENITAMVNAPLFEWVIENLCKNAVDAMSGIGRIDISVLRGNDNKVYIDVSDSGKGIPKSKIKQVFNPGFTTKKRGWGLGLTLVQRIIEIYHKGKIFVKASEENQGTTFRIVVGC